MTLKKILTDKSAFIPCHHLALKLSAREVTLHSNNRLQKCIHRYGAKIKLHYLSAHTCMYVGAYTYYLCICTRCDHASGYRVTDLVQLVAFLIFVMNPEKYEFQANTCR